MLRRTVLLVVLSMLCGGYAKASASNIFITASGAASGACTASVQTPAFFNNVANWGPGGAQIGPDTIVLICGTFNAAAGTCDYLSFQGSGTSGHPVTLRWDTNAVVQAPFFCANHTSGGVTINGNSFVVVDGGTNGVLQNTANGTGLTFSSPSTLLGIIGASNFQVKNLQMLNDYVRSGTDTVCAANNDWCSAIFGGFGSNVTIGPGNTITWCDVCIHTDWQGGEHDLRITGNTGSHYNQFIEMGPSNSGTRVINNIRVDHNVATPSRDWDEPSNSYHHNFFHPFTNRVGSAITGILQVDNNSVIGDVGTHPTSTLSYFENSNGGSGCPAPCGAMSAPYIFNNIAKKTNTDSPGSTGMFVAWVGVDNGYLLNNTFVDAGSGGNSNNTWPEFNMTGVGWTDKNNIFVQGSNSYYFGNNNSTNAPTADFNMYFSNPAGALWTWAPGSGGYTPSFSAWKTFCSCDSHAVSGTDPVLNSITLKPGVSANFGTNLTSLAGTLGIPDLLNDINGSPRGAGTWTVGAVNFGTAVAPLPGPPPVLFSAIVTPRPGVVSGQ